MNPRVSPKKWKGVAEMTGANSEKRFFPRAYPVKLAFVRFAAAFLLMVAAMPSPALSMDKERVLHVYTWADYFDSQVINEFQKRHDCRVAIHTFDSNERMYELLQYDSGDYDVLTPSSYMCSLLYEGGVLAELDHGKLPNLRHLVPVDRGYDDDMKYSVPYARTVTGVGYDTTRVGPEALGSWNIFANHAYAGKMTMLDDPRECLGAALKYLGHSLNSPDDDEIAAAARLVAEWKANLAAFDTDTSKQDLIDGKMLAVQGYNGDMIQAMTANPDIGFYVPAEGAALTWDEMVIPKQSPMQDLAHAFINHMLDPEMARLNMEGVLYYMPNPAALETLDPKLRHHAAFDIPEDILSSCEIIRDIGPDAEKYAKAWETLRQ